jgi:hypothetical protein
MAPLLERQERFELFDEPAEVHQPGFWIAVDAIGQVGHQVLEVAGDAADGGVPGRQLRAHPIHTLGEAGGDGLNRLLLRLLPQPFVLHEHAIDGFEQCLFLRRVQVQAFPHPLVKVGPCFRVGRIATLLWLTHSHDLACTVRGPSLQTMCRRSLLG